MKQIDVGSMSDDEFTEILQRAHEVTGVDKLVLRQVYLSYFEEMSARMADQKGREIEDVDVIRMPFIGRFQANTRYFKNKKRNEESKRKG